MTTRLNSEHRAFFVTSREAGIRLDSFIASRCPDMTRAQLQRLIAQKSVLVEKHPAKQAQRVRSGEAVVLIIPPPTPTHANPEALPLDIVYEDSDLLVVDKPTGMTVHPAPGHRSGTLVNALLAHCSDLAGIGGEIRPGIVHRLDKDTSGLLVVAKRESALRGLQEQFKAREVTKGYLTLVWGTPLKDEDIIEAPIGRDPRHRKRMAVVHGGKNGTTVYHVLRRYSQMSLLEVFPKTGRTHQIRVHLSFINHPLVGDHLYRRRASPLSRQFLHAHLLGFRHPRDKEHLQFTSKLPEDLSQFLGSIEAEETSGTP